MTSAQLERFLREFPWLWGILPVMGYTKIWGPNTARIRVGRATRAVFDAGWSYKIDTWVYGIRNLPCTEHSYCLDCVHTGWDDRVGSHVLFSTGHWGDGGLLYVAVVDARGKTPGILILRPPKGATYKAWLQKYSPRPQGFWAHQGEPTAPVDEIRRILDRDHAMG